jgi:prepilin-type N-terminal cleavage/methylation domain-containing protein
MSTQASRRKLDQSGFSLAEVLLAMFLLGLLAIGVSALLTQLVGGNDRSRIRLEARARAIAVAESLLTRDYATLATGTTNGTGPLGVDWSLSISQEAPNLRRIAVLATKSGESSRVETLVSNRFVGLP